MEELTETKHLIKLTIKEGRKFDNVLCPTIIVASLNNHSLESDLIQPDSNPKYLINLVWSTEKKILRKMRSGQTPLKIECFALNENGNREKIGYILLSIRTAQIISKNEDVDIRFNWHTLLGLKSNLKDCKPELSLSLVIEEVSIDNNMINQDALSYQGITPVLMEHEHVIQLGPIDSCNDLFLITIMTGIVNNLDILIKEPILSEHIEDVRFWYHIMNNNIQLNPLNKSSERQWIINEKVYIRIRSSLTVLRQYFQLQPYLLIFLKLKNNIIAQSKLDIRPLIFTDCLKEFIKKTQNSSTSLEQQCVLISDEDVFNVHEPKASISVKFKVQYVDKKYEQSQFPKIPPRDIPLKTQDVASQRIVDNEPTKTTSTESCRNPAEELEIPTPQTYSEYNTMQHNNQLINQLNFNEGDAELNFENECPKSIEAFHCYCLNVYLTGITLYPTCPLIQNIEFRFHHPKAEIMSTLHPAIPVMSGKKLSLQNIGCKLHFISSADEIKKLLISFPPRISVCDDNFNTKTCIGQTDLDMQKLFNQQMPECQYEAMLLNADKTQIGTLDVVMNLEDHGPYYNEKSRNSGENLGPPILDDSLVYKIVDELESWKERQKEIFKMELKNREEYHLNVLAEEWRKKKDVLEAKLANSVEQCKMLANTLNDATEDLRIRRLKSHEKETHLLKANEELQQRYEMKIQDLRLSCEKMQNDFAAELKQFEECKHSYEIQINNLKRENEQLRRTIKIQDDHLEDIEKGVVYSEQVTLLLQKIDNLEKKLADVQENKNYYKEQWNAVHSEMEAMRCKYEHALKMQIESTDKLKNSEYEDILCASSQALITDQMYLNRMQQKLELIEPKSVRLISEVNPTYTNINNLLTNPSQNMWEPNFPGRNEERETKLQMLVTEKEELLKTGSYENDDPVIVKLNNEIKSLLSVVD